MVLLALVIGQGHSTSSGTATERREPRLSRLAAAAGQKTLVCGDETGEWEPGILVDESAPNIGSEAPSRAAALTSAHQPDRARRVAVE